MSEALLSYQPCDEPGCGSSDAKTYYLDGGSKCFACGKAKHKDSPDSGAKATTPTQHTKKKVTVGEARLFANADLSSRGITTGIAELFGVKQSFDGTSRQPEDWFFPFTKDNEIVGYKARKIKEKSFYSIGTLGKEVDPFGWHRVSAGGKMIVITEGEMDALSATQMIKSKGKDYKVLSIPNGAQSASAFIGANLNKFEHFEKVILNFDKDDAGIDAMAEAAKMFKPGQCFIMTLPEGFKDANDLLVGGQPYQYMDAINQAKEYRPDGIIAGIDTWDLYVNRPEIQSYPFPEDWTEANKMTYGIRLSELDTYTSGTSAGKTQLVRELINHYAHTTDLKQGILSLEEPITDTVEAQIELELNKRISLPDVNATDEEKHEAWKKIWGTGKLDLYDAFGGEEVSVMQNIRYMSKGMGCQLIWVDHLHMLLDGKDSEKEQIERVMLTLKKLTQELGCYIGLIAHLKKSGGGLTFEEGAIANLDDLKGSSSIKQLSNGVYVMSRDQQADDYLTRNTTQITVKKCRFTGRTGNADRLKFSDETGRMTKLNDDEVLF